MTKYSILIAVLCMICFVPMAAGQCPEFENFVFYNADDTIYSIDLSTGVEEIIVGMPDDIEGTTLIEGRVINALAANPDAGGIIYFANGTSIFGYYQATDSLFAISNLLDDYPAIFTGSRLNSGGGSFYEDHYYLGSDCDAIYDIEMSSDGMSIISVTKLISEIFEFGDLIVLSAGCTGNPTMYISSAFTTPIGCTSFPLRSGTWSYDLTTGSFTLAFAAYEGQLATNAAGEMFRGGVPGGNGTEIQRIDPCTGAFTGPILNASNDIDDMTGPGLCPQVAIVMIEGQPDFDTIPGYNTLVIDVLLNDPPNSDPSSVSIINGPSNGLASNSAGIIDYTPTFGYTGYDTLFYRFCAINSTINCDTVMVVIAIGDDHDMDGLLDIHECPMWDLDIASCDLDGDNIPNIYDLDSDGDSILDEFECPNYNGVVGSCDTDGDGAPDYLDLDSDDDGLSDTVECQGWTGSGCDTDNDGTPNFRDDDSDGDSFLDGTFTEFPTSDCDSDGTSDYLDPDPCDVNIPEAFSPNGDGLNDVFEIVGLQSYPNNRLKVYSRWGEEVVNLRNYQNNWKGNNLGKQEIIKGDLLPVGTYYVLFEYESLGALRTYNGIVYINY